MPKAYIVGLYREVRDPDKLAAYAEFGIPTVLANGGRVLAGAIHWEVPVPRFRTY
jgi:hypothetical protein